MTLLTLPSVPATVAASTGVAFRLTFHEADLAIGMAALTGTFALFSVLLVSPEAQRTIRMWIRHRAEHRLAAAEAFEIRRRIRAATCGRRWSAASAVKIRQGAEACKRPNISLPKVMQITRTDSFAEVPRARWSRWHFATRNEEVRRRSLGVAPERNAPD